MKKFTLSHFSTLHASVWQLTKSRLLSVLTNTFSSIICASYFNQDFVSQDVSKSIWLKLANTLIIVFLSLNTSLRILSQETTLISSLNFASLITWSLWFKNLTWKRLHANDEKSTFSLSYYFDFGGRISFIRDRIFYDLIFQHLCSFLQNCVSFVISRERKE